MKDLNLIGVVIKLLSNLRMSSKNVKETSGYMTLMCISATCIMTCKKDIDKKYLKAGIGGSILFGGIYLWLDNREENKENKKTERQTLAEYRKREAETESYEAKKAADAKSYMMKAQVDAMLHKAKAQTDIVRYKAMREIDLEYEQKRAKKNDDKQVPINSPQLSHQWEGHSYGDKVNQTFTKASTIIPGFLERGLVHGLGGATSVGKSIYMHDIALAVGKGGRAYFLEGEVIATKMRVVYYQLEVFPGEENKKYGEGKIFDGADILWKTRNDLPSFTLNGLLDDIEQYAQQAICDTLIEIDPLSKLSDYSADVFFQRIERIQEIGGMRGFTFSFLYSFHMYEVKDSSSISTVNIKGSDRTVQQSGAFYVIRNEQRGDDFKFMQELKPMKGNPSTRMVSVSRIVVEKIDEQNWYTHLKYVEGKDLVDAMPHSLKPKKKEPIYPPQEVQLENKDSGSRIDSVPREVVLKMAEWYKKGVPGHGLQACVKFGKDYGLKYATEVSRLFEKYGISVDDKKDEGQQ